jgi:hypothetical protein
MTEKYFFADVEQPFHVWVKEGTRWVLRDAGSDLHLAGCPPLARNPGVEGMKPSSAT